MSNSNSNEAMAEKIILSIARDDDELELTVDAYSGSLHVQGSAFFSEMMLRTSISTFDAFPIGRGTGASICGGYYNDKGTDLTSEHLRIDVVPLDDVGRLIMRVKVFLPDPQYWQEGFGKGGQFDYAVSYEAVKEFARNVERLIRGEISEFEFSRFE